MVSTQPRNWRNIVLHIKDRALDRCECGTFWDCGTGIHPSRCNNREGRRDPVNRRKEIRLHIVQVGPPDDWSPDYLIALCGPCWKIWDERRRAKAIAAEREPGLW